MIFCFFFISLQCTKLNERLQVAKAGIYCTSRDYMYIILYIMYVGSENITPEVVEKVHTEHKAAVTHWRKRKRLVRN